MGPTGDFEVTVTPITDIEAVGREWQVMEEVAQPSIFLSWLWIGTWLRTISSPAYFAVVSRAGKRAGLAVLCPTRQRRHRVLSVRQVHLNRTGDPDEDIINLEYNGLLCRQEDRLDVLKALIDGVVSAEKTFEGFDQVDEFVVANVDVRTRDALIGEGYVIREFAIAPSFFVDVGALRKDGQSLLLALSKNARYQIRRSLRLYEENGPIRVERAATVDQAKAFLEELRPLHQSTWESRGREGAFFYPFFKMFHERMIEACVESENLDVLKITNEDEIIGYIYNFIYYQTAYYYLSGFVYKNDHKFKPGLVSHLKCVEYYQERGLDVYDFMAGASQYKASLGQPGPVLSSFAVQRPQPKLWAEARLRDLKHRWEAWRAGRQPAPEQARADD